MKIALVDGYNLAFRAFYGMPELTREDGFPTGALHGWVRSLWWVEDHVKPDRIIVFFDLGGADRQTALLEDYKANRKDTPEPLQEQMPWIKKWTRAAGYLGVEKEGVEADDLIASYSVCYAEQGHEVLIVSADKDLGQLVRGNVKQLLPPPTANPKLGWRELDEAGVREKFGVEPKKIAHYLALVGDTSDNIPGLRGVGPKTAAKWIAQYGSIEGVINHSGELTPKRFQSLVHAEQENLRRNLQMTTLQEDLEVQPLEQAPLDLEQVIGILDEMEMRTSAKSARDRYQ